MNTVASVFITVLRTMHFGQLIAWLCVRTLDATVFITIDPALWLVFAENSQPLLYLDLRKAPHYCPQEEPLKKGRFK